MLRYVLLLIIRMLGKRNMVCVCRVDKGETTEFRRVNCKWCYKYDSRQDGAACRTSSMENSKKATLKCTYSELHGYGVRHVIDPLYLNTLRTGLLNCLNERSRGLTFRYRASCI